MRSGAKEKEEELGEGGRRAEPCTENADEEGGDEANAENMDEEKGAGVSDSSENHDIT